MQKYHSCSIKIAMVSYFVVFGAFQRFQGSLFIYFFLRIGDKTYPVNVHTDETNIVKASHLHRRKNEPNETNIVADRP